MDFLLLRRRGGRNSKLLTHSSGRITDDLDGACKLLLRYAKMPRPNPDLIFTVDDYLAAVAGYVRVGFHGLLLSGFAG